MNKVLVVDDESSIRDMIKVMLESSTLQVELAENGINALKVLANNDIDLVITDIVMPQENGIDLIMDMKKKYPNTPVIAISGGGGIEGRFDYLEIAKLVGANHILEKPFSQDVLCKVVADLLVL